MQISLSPDKDKHIFRVALVALLAGAAVIGFAPIFVRICELGPTATAMWRLVLAVPFLWTWMRLESQGNARYRRPATRRDYWSLILAGLFFAGDIAIWHWSIQRTSVANATLLVNLAPVFVALASFILFKERFRYAFLAGLTLAIVGSFALMARNLEVGGVRLTGDVLALVAALFYAGYIVSVGRLRASFSTATVMTWTAVTSALVLVPMTILSGEAMWPASLYGWGVLLALALLSHVTGQGLIAFGLAHLPAAFGAVSLLVQPITAAILAWVLFGERLGPVEIAGAALVLAGIATARRGVGVKRIV